MTNLTIGLNTNIEYKNIIVPILQTLVNCRHENEVASLCNEDRKVWIDGNKKYSYLFISQMNTLTICYSEKIYKNDKENFSFHLEQIEKYDSFLPNPLLKIYLGNTITSEEEKKQLEKKYENVSPLKLYAMNFFDQFYKEKGNIYDSTSLTKSLKDFHKYLFEKNYTNEQISEEILMNSGKATAKSDIIQDKIKQLLPQLIQLKEITNELGYSSKNKLIFNDGDSTIWIPNLQNAIGFSSQDIKFIAVSRNNDKDWQILHFDSEISQHKNEKSIINSIVNGTITNDDIVLLVQDEVAKYVGSGFECMEMDVRFSLKAIIEDKQYEESKCVKKSKNKM